jgi:hypothetical protein
MAANKDGLSIKSIKTGSDTGQSQKSHNPLGYETETRDQPCQCDLCRDREQAELTEQALLATLQATSERGQHGEGLGGFHGK